MHATKTARVDIQLKFCHNFALQSASLVPTAIELPLNYGPWLSSVELGHRMTCVYVPSTQWTLSIKKGGEQNCRLSSSSDVSPRKGSRVRSVQYEFRGLFGFDVF